MGIGVGSSHVFLELLQVRMLLSKLLLERQQLFCTKSGLSLGKERGVRSRYLLLLTLADSEVLGCLLTLGERVTRDSQRSALSSSICLGIRIGGLLLTLDLLLGEHQSHQP